MTDINLEHLQQWIGRTETVSDIITPTLVDRFKATFAEKLWNSETGVPLGLHWCLAPVTVSGEFLGDDGHPNTGGFLPPVPLPSRMWAGGEVSFHSNFNIGDNVIRTSRIASVTLKNGKSGPLVFVTVEHECRVQDHLVISERQDIVYKEARAKVSLSKPKATEAPTAAGYICMDEVTLFRYSALTFNGHRIHYDRDYACFEEEYPGIVVHGPLQATFLMNRAAAHSGEIPKRFSYRGVSPLIIHTPFRLDTAGSADFGEIRCLDVLGNVTMIADYSTASPVHSDTDESN